MDNCTGIINTHDSKYSASLALIDAAQTITDAFVDCGSEVNTRGFRHVKFYATIDINNGANVRFRVLGKHTYEGTEEYKLNDTKVKVLANNTYTAAAASMYFEIDDDADQLVVISVDTDNTIDSLQLQVSAGTVGATACQIDALYCLRGA